MTTLSHHCDTVRNRRAELAARIADAHDGERKNSLQRMLSEIDRQLIGIKGWKKQGPTDRPVSGGGATVAKAIIATTEQRSSAFIPLDAVRSDAHPQDPGYDGAGWTFQLLDHALLDDMPQTILATDARGRQAKYLLAKQRGVEPDELGQ